MDEEMMEAVNNQARQTYREAVGNPATEAKDRDLSIEIQFTSKFIDDERVNDLAKKYKEEFSRMRQQEHTTLISREGEISYET